ncbi:hypothetical protein D3C75_1308970 [compost metagenome]
MPGTPQAAVVLIGQACCAYMWRDIAQVVGQRAAQAFAVDQQLIQLTGQGLLDEPAYIVTVRLATEDSSI